MAGYRGDRSPCVRPRGPRPRSGGGPPRPGRCARPPRALRPARWLSRGEAQSLSTTAMWRRKPCGAACPSPRACWTSANATGSCDASRVRGDDDRTLRRSDTAVENGRSMARSPRSTTGPRPRERRDWRPLLPGAPVLIRLRRPPGPSAGQVVLDLGPAFLSAPWRPRPVRARGEESGLGGRAPAGVRRAVRTWTWAPSRVRLAGRESLLLGTKRREPKPRSAPASLLYEPRHRSARLPLSLLHVASGSTHAWPSWTAASRWRLWPWWRSWRRKRFASGSRHPRSRPRRRPRGDARGEGGAADLPVIWGGPHATLRPAECLGTGVVDACVLGAGERTLRDMVEALGAGGPNPPSRHGLPARSAGGESLPRASEDVSHLPPLDYALLDLERHFASVAPAGRKWSRAAGASHGALVRPPPPGAGPRAGPGAAAAGGQVVFLDQGFFADASRAAAIAAAPPGPATP